MPVHGHRFLLDVAPFRSVSRSRRNNGRRPLERILLCLGRELASCSSRPCGCRPLQVPHNWGINPVSRRREDSVCSARIRHRAGMILFLKARTVDAAGTVVEVIITDVEMAGNASERAACTDSNK